MFNMNKFIEAECIKWTLSLGQQKAIAEYFMPVQGSGTHSKVK